MTQNEKKRRLQNTTICCPFIYGSFAQIMPKKTEDNATHKWTIFVRSPNGEDLSTFISSVTFKLHPSFTEPIRDLKEPPFEITETGWGEFEVGIRLNFKDASEQPVDLSHMLKLYSPDPAANAARKPVISESYDELVFTDPTIEFNRHLLLYGRSNGTVTTGIAAAAAAGASGNQRKRRSSLDFECYFMNFSDETDLHILSAALDHMQHEINVTKSSLYRAESEVKAILSSVATQQAKAAAAAAAAAATNTTTLVTSILATALTAATITTTATTTATTVTTTSNTIPATATAATTPPVAVVVAATSDPTSPPSPSPSSTQIKTEVISGTEKIEIKTESPAAAPTVTPPAASSASDTATTTGATDESPPI